MNQTNIFLCLATRWTILGLLVCSTVTLWADDQTQGKCQDCCDIVGYRPKAIVNLIVIPGKKPYAQPECACVKRGGTVIWRNEDAEVPWTIVFDKENPIDNPGKVSDYDDEWIILGNAKGQEYHYTANIGGQDVDPHVVVGPHPPFSDANKHKKAKKSQQ